MGFNQQHWIESVPGGRNAEVDRALSEAVYPGLVDFGNLVTLAASRIPFNQSN